MKEALREQVWKHIRNRLAKKRESQGITQTELAKKIGKHQTFVSKYETDQSSLNVMDFIAVCTALRVSPSKLIENARKN
ncbi:helix-turn-helix domain-containing protein [Rhodopirellula sp. MGV]|uniref:helix-turn-helix domain-containing protein n=1 Tax=Rhodopirellula sp. MGV TaxID=2023130 RepID=UPI000B97B311|nr:helix-turn-helix transcriptional regulator [Rhodopirellula sp. MGV]OYP36445.1 hypothetical protein CGZ80_09080 [Rhodopirellula sp. MGV]PNY36872.1 XRE family transcriptional regulator [Rhodopirellula baltica]